MDRVNFSIIMIKKNFVCLAIFLVFSPVHAGNRDIWVHIHSLQTQVNILQQQVTTVPKYLSGEGIRIEGNVISTVTRHIGEIYHGGIIFWLDDSKRHGLIASLHDLNDNEGLQWRNGESGSKNTNARANGIGAGDTNTRLIIAQQTADNQYGHFAALVAAQYNVLEDGETVCPVASNPSSTCYGDWYLPSLYELSLLKKNIVTQGFATFVPDYYWSSTEVNVSNAWLQNFSTGEFLSSDKANTLGHVRAVRKF